MKHPGILIQFFTFVEDGRGPPGGKPEKFLFSKLIYLLKTLFSKHLTLQLSQMLSSLTHCSPVAPQHLKLSGLPDRPFSYYRSTWTNSVVPVGR